MEILEADQRVHVEHAHGLGVGLGDLLDVHPAHARQHRHRFLRRAVEHHGGVVLLVDLARLLDPHLVDREAAVVHAEDRGSVLLGRGRVGGELDPARLAAPADLHLGLDDDRVAQLVGGFYSLLHGGRVTTLRHGNSVLGEELFALVFE